jgi:hypothetical protein
MASLIDIYESSASGQSGFSGAPLYKFDNGLDGQQVNGVGGSWNWTN